MIKMETIVLGGGCFWCTEAIFSMIGGVKSVVPGYAGGSKENPTYEEVCTGTTGHAEVIKVEYDPKITGLHELLEVFFAMHDPTTPDRQGNDVGPQYRSIILYANEAQRKAAESFIREIAFSYKSKIVTTVQRLGKFYPAEKEHVNYYQNNKNMPYCRLVISPKIQKIVHKLSESGMRMEARL